jgi:membrane peptidoglycan carboxypeptidase
MGNIFWNGQQPGANRPANNVGNLPAGRSLREYGQQQQYSPSMPAPQGPPPYSPVPPGHPLQQQRWPLPHPSQSPGNQSWAAGTMRMIRHWSGKMRTVPSVDQQPLVLYHPSLPSPVEKSKPWKRSRIMRISMHMRRRRDRWQRTHLNGSKIATTIAMVIGLLLVIATSAGTASAYAYYQAQLPRVQGLANQQISQTSHIYDRNGVLLYDVYDNNGGGRRTSVSYQYIPQVMRDAMVAAEDSTFWENPGIDPQAIFRAGIQYLQDNNQVVSGASTLTQQLIKNLTNDRQVSLSRKLPEAALAIGLTQQYPKWKILEMYLNISPFGAQELGVESAVEDYFHLAPQCNAQHVCIPAIANLDVNAQGQHDPLLGLARASLLAGMPQNPPSYDPTISPDNRARALARQDYVLGQMLKLGMQVQGLGTITPAIVQQAEALTAKMTFTPYTRQIRAPHFVYWVIQQLEDQIGVEALLTGGFNIYTTIDINLENFVENAVRRHLDKPEWQPFVGDYGPLNTVHNVNDSAVVVMSAKTGEILAMDGSTDWSSNNPKVDGRFNAALAYRQPGSSFKPIVYATAFQMGWYPGMVLPDRLTYFPTGPGSQTNPQKNAYHPTDYGGGYHNMNSTIRLDIANSFNIPAIKAFEYAGLDNVVNMARRLGVTAIDEDVAMYNQSHKTNVGLSQAFGPALALGTAGVPLLQMVGAYQVFANQGVHIPPKSILDIWDNYGHHLYHFDPTHPGGVQVISPQIAYLMTSILSDEPARAIEFSGDHVLSMYDWQQADGQKHEVAAKTGTTDNFVDNWTLGYTPDVVVGVWSGNADNSPFVGNVVGITGAAPIWHSVIERASGACNVDGAGIPCGKYHSSFTQQTFIMPPGVSQQAVSKLNGLKGTGITDWMLDSDVPQQTGFPKDNTGNGNGNGNNNGNGTPTPGPGNGTLYPTPTTG